MPSGRHDWVSSFGNFRRRYRALEYRVDSDPLSLDETAKIISWNTNKNIGKAQRPCGCHIFIANILDERVYGIVGVGDWIRYKLERSITRNGWVGVWHRKSRLRWGKERNEMYRIKNDSGHDRIAGILREHGLVSSQAFVNTIYDYLLKNGGNFAKEQVILDTAQRVKVPQDESLFDGVFEGFPERDTPGNRLMLLSESPLPITPANLSKAFHAIMRGGDLTGKLGVTQEEYARQQAAHHKQSLISTISGGGQHKTYPLFAANHGAFKYPLCSSLENESDEMLEALALRVPEWREQIAGGKKQREQLPDGVTATQHARERELESDEFLTFPDSDPPREYTIKEAKQNLRELLFYPDSRQGRGPRRVKAVNRLLSGRKFGESN